MAMTLRGLIGPLALPRRLQRCRASSTARSSRPPPRVARPYKPSPIRPEATGSPSPPGTDTLLALWRRSWILLSGAAMVAGFMGFYMVGTAAASSRPCPHPHVDPAAVPTGRPPALTGDQAEQFDRTLDWSEWWMGITSLRRDMARRARGHVLEVAAGTGRNLEYYNWGLLHAVLTGGPGPSAKALSGIVSFTGLDISVDMLDVARRRLVRAVPPMASAAAVAKASNMADHTGGQMSFLNGHIRLVHSDAHGHLPPAPWATNPVIGYDTVIQTFGLCSVADPVAVLSNLASVVKPNTGRIILLEHGRGWYGLVNGLLDNYAGKHFAKFGCWWNRDIDALVHEAVRRTPGLELVKLEHPKFWQLGTLICVELRMVGKP